MKGLSGLMFCYRLSMDMDGIMRAAPVIPVLVLDGTLDAAALAETLVAAGLPVIEVTLRTPAALPAISAVAAVPGAIVGAGTVLDAPQLGKAVDAGAKFIVSPGLTKSLAAADHRQPPSAYPGRLRRPSRSENRRRLRTGGDFQRRARRLPDPAFKRP
jgi:Entner-Doudoroff aldolase